MSPPSSFEKALEFEPSFVRTADASALSSAISTTLDIPLRLLDNVTGLPALTSLFDELNVLTEDLQGLTTLYLHFPNTEIIEERYGWEVYEAYSGLVANYLRDEVRRLRRERGQCFVMRGYADDYIVLMPYRDPEPDWPSLLIGGMQRHLQAMDDELVTLHQALVGAVRTTPFAKIHPERWIYRSIQRAQNEAMDEVRQNTAANARILDRCIAERAFKMLYQPIVRAADRQIMAYEALVRCTQQELRNPHFLFSVAEQSGRLWPLSRLLRLMSAQDTVQMPEGALLFMNMHPHDFEDPQLMPIEPTLLSQASRVVVEVTERAAISDYDRFRGQVDQLREAGMRLAVDDLGSGYAALSSIAELAPDFIKFDMALIRGIDQSPIRQQLVQRMVDFAIDTGAQVVAEGVETQAEFDTVCALGCHLVQGFYLAHPAPPFVRVVNAG